MPPLKKFKQKHKGLHKILVYFCIIGLFWGGWRIYDSLAGGESWEYAIPGIAVVFTALVVLYLDDFHLKELE